VSEELAVPASEEAGALEAGAAPFTSSCACTADHNAATAASAASIERFMNPLTFERLI
jgi:hypothetical protein